jgi:hypothetical protein
VPQQASMWVFLVPLVVLLARQVRLLRVQVLLLC